MKLNWKAVTPLTALSVAGLCSAGYLIPWSTVDSGGGTSSAQIGTSTWKLTGTIGQADVTSAPASGGTYSLNGGYWAQVIQSPGGPPLTLTGQPNGSVLVEWTAAAQGWQLQESVNLGSWSEVGTTISSPGNLIVQPSPGIPKKFFRLWKP